MDLRARYLLTSLSCLELCLAKTKSSNTEWNYISNIRVEETCFCLYIHEKCIVLFSFTCCTLFLEALSVDRDISILRQEKASTHSQHVHRYHLLYGLEMGVTV